MAVALALGTLAAPASASFPGRNGTIVYSWLGESAFRAGPSATSIRAVDTRAGLVRVLRDCPLLRGGPSAYAECIVSVPRVSPDGTRVAFPSTQVTPHPMDPWEFRPGVALMGSDGSGLEEHPGANTYGSLAWSPAGDRLLLSRQFGPGGTFAGGIYLSSLDGTELSQVAPAGNHSPDWSSTGRIAFARQSADPNCVRRCVNIWLTRLGGTPRKLTHRGGYSPSWSPHASKLAFVRTVGTGADIFLVGRDGRGLRRLTRRGGYNPSWSPNGRWIAFIRAGELFVVRTNGRGLRRVVAGPSAGSGEGPQVTYIDWARSPPAPAARAARPH